MATNIEWTMSDDGTPGKTWNPTRGCSRISPGCLHCYAETMAARFVNVKNTFGEIIQPGVFRDYVHRVNGRPSWTGKVDLIESRLLDPLRWKKPCRCFVNSMSDLFHESLSPILIDRVFAVMALCPHITFQVLTKRADVMQAYVNEDAHVRVNRQIELWMEFMEDFPKGRAFPRYCEEWPLKNVWLGVSVENQKYADERIPLLLKTPAAIRFVSYEPALGPVDFSDHLLMEPPLSWIICGGESGPGARPFSVRWARDTVEQCKTTGVPCFVKQLGSRPCLPTCADPECTHPDCDPGFVRLKDRKGGEMSEWDISLRVRQFPEVTCKP